VKETELSQDLSARNHPLDRKHELVQNKAPATVEKDELRKKSVTSHVLVTPRKQLQQETSVNDPGMRKIPERKTKVDNSGKPSDPNKAPNAMGKLSDPNKAPNATGKPSDPNKAPNATGKPSDPNKAPNATGKPSDPNKAPNATGKPSDPNKTQNATGKPSDPNKAPHATGKPSDPNKAQNATGKPSDPNKAPNATGKPSDPNKAPNAMGKLSDPNKAPNATGKPSGPNKAPNATGKPSDPNKATNAMGKLSDPNKAPNATGKLSDPNKAPNATGKFSDPNKAPNAMNVKKGKALQTVNQRQNQSSNVRETGSNELDKRQTNAEQRNFTTNRHDDVHKGNYTGSGRPQAKDSSNNQVPTIPKLVKGEETDEQEDAISYDQDEDEAPVHSDGFYDDNEGDNEEKGKKTEGNKTVSMVT